MIRPALRALLRVLFRLLARVEARGLENIPTHGGAILATNHLSRLDIALIFVSIERNDLTGLVAKKYQRVPPIRWLVNLVGGIWLDREAADVAALRAARDFVRAGGLLGIAPEGTRSQTHTLQPAKAGVAYLAAKADAPIVPIAITGTEAVIQAWLRLQRARLTIQFGEPFRLAPIEPRDRDASLRRNTDEIMARIAVMLPPAYRGVYAGHPRLDELLAVSRVAGGHPAV